MAFGKTYKDGKFLVSPVEIEERLKRYIEEVEVEKKMPTPAELAFRLGVNKGIFKTYKKKDKCREILDWSMDWILACLEYQLQKGAAASLIFLAKNLGYSDKLDQVIESKISVTLTGDVKKWAK